jgi:hypothetical protein
MPDRRHGSLALAAVGAALLQSCDGTPLPGTMLGTYTVVGQAQTNSCNLTAPSPWTFDAQLSEDGTLLYWSWLNGTSPLSAPVSSEMATLVASEQANVDGSDGGAGPCTMQRDDNLELTLGSGSPPTSFTGTLTYAFSVVPGANCSDQLAAQGGSYAELPCTLSYALSATRQ